MPVYFPANMKNPRDCLKAESFVAHYKETLEQTKEREKKEAVDKQRVAKMFE